MTGSEYLKDHCICDEGMDEEILIIDKEIDKNEKDAKKNAKKNEEKVQSDQKWDEFFAAHSFSDAIMVNELNTYKFPSKL